MAGYYNPKKDYAAAIKAEKNPAKQAQLKAERQNKIDAMNAAGTNTKGYTNSIYGGSYSSSGKGNSSSGGDGKGNSSGGYFDKNLDYAAAIRNEKDPVKQAKLIAERQNKLNWMNASGTNTKGYTNDIYGGMPQASAPQGQYRSTEAALNNTNKAAIQPTATTQTQTAAAAEAENPTAPTSFGSTDAAQRAALQAYITRQYAHQKAESGEGTYNGDGSMSLPDQTLLKSYQQKYNEAKAAGDQGGMTAAHRAAEKLRDNYRYYPLAHSNGYGLGENDIGWVRDLVVRGDELGNKIVDQYNRGTFTTTTYDKDGNFVNRYTGGNIAGHDARVAKEMQRVNEKLAGKENNTFAFRLSDPNDVKLSNAELLAKYGGGITEGNNGIGLYTAPNGTVMKTTSGGGDSGRLRHRDGRGGKFRLRAIRLLRPEQGLCGGGEERKQHAGDGAAGEGAAEQAELDERERNEQGLHQPDLQQLQQPFRGKAGAARIHRDDEGRAFRRLQRDGREPCGAEEGTAFRRTGAEPDGAGEGKQQL